MSDSEDAVPAGAEGFIEAMGLYFEQLGVPRIGGRMLGLLLVSEGPRSLDDIASTLRVSRASVSTNARMLTATGLAERVSLPGDRRDYYVFSPEGWERPIKVAMESMQTLRRLAARGLASLPADNDAGRRRLAEMVRFGDFYVQSLTDVLAHWRERASAHAHAAAADGAGSRPS